MDNLLKNTILEFFPEYREVVSSFIDQQDSTSLEVFSQHIYNSQDDDSNPVGKIDIDVYMTIYEKYLKSKISFDLCFANLFNGIIYLAANIKFPNLTRCLFASFNKTFSFGSNPGWHARAFETDGSLPDTYSTDLDIAIDKFFTPSYKGNNAVKPNKRSYIIFSKDDIITPDTEESGMRFDRIYYRSSNETVIDISKVIENIILDLATFSDAVIYGSYALHLFNHDIKYNDIDVFCRDPYVISHSFLSLLFLYFGIETNILKVPLVHNYYKLSYNDFKIYDFSGIWLNYSGGVVAVNGIRVVAPIFQFLNSIIRIGYEGRIKSEDREKLKKKTLVSLNAVVKQRSIVYERIKKVKVPTTTYTTKVIKIKIPGQHLCDITNLYFFIENKLMFKSLLTKLPEEVDGMLLLNRPYGYHNEICILFERGLKEDPDNAFTDIGINVNEPFALMTRNTMVIPYNVTGRCLTFHGMIVLLASYTLHLEYNNIKNKLFIYILNCIGNNNSEIIESHILKRNRATGKHYTTSIKDEYRLIPYKMKFKYFKNLNKGINLDYLDDDPDNRPQESFKGFTYTEAQQITNITVI